jgi:hypothetical protein
MEPPGKKRKKGKETFDPLGDHLNTCTTHSGAKRDTTGWLIKFLTFFAQHVRLKHNRWLKSEVNIVETSNWRDI